jgi:hypothetical protein
MFTKLFKDITRYKSLSFSISSKRNKSFEQVKAQIDQLFSGLPPTVSPVDSNMQLKDDLGKAFKRSKDKDNKSILQLASPEEIKNSKSMIIGGLGQDDRKGLSVLGKSAEIMVGNLKENEVLDPIIIHPLASRKERIEAGYKFIEDKRYIAKYIEPLAHEYIIPYFYNESKTYLTLPTKNKTIFTFSTGARDMYMLRNYSINYLIEKYKFSGFDVMMFLNRIFGLTLGGVPDQGNVWNLDFRKNVIFSVMDKGVKLPVCYKSIIYDEWELFCNKKYSVKKAPSFFPLPFNIFLIGKDAMPIVYDESVDIDGHGLKHYGAAVYNMPYEYHYPNRELLVHKTNEVIDISLIGDIKSDISHD